MVSKYCGAVVWFNPDQSCVDNIQSYIGEIDKLYIVDNSVNDNSFLADRFEKKCCYISLAQNKGLAYALKYACEKAIKDGFDFILTMDQDSSFEAGAVSDLKKFMEKTNEQYAIVAPNVKSVYENEKMEETIAYITMDSTDCKEVNWVMTSGSLMSLKAYAATEGFDSDMFIAHVDIDLAIKLKKNNEKIVMLGKAIIKQHFGNSRPRKILWKTVHPSFASPVRTYYLFRNQKYLEAKYGKEAKKFIGVSLWKFVVKILLFEDEKFEKCRMMIRGMKDAKSGHMGEYSYVK